MPEKIKKSFAIKCLENRKTVVTGAIIIIGLGIWLGTWQEHHVHEIPPLRNIFLITLWHGMVIFGEIVAVAFFIHHVIDEQLTKHHAENIKDAAQKTIKIVDDTLVEWKIKVANDFQDSIDSVSKKSMHRVDNTMNSWSDNMQHRTKDVLENLFKGLLQGLDILPYHMVDLIKKAAYNPQLLRRKLVMSYEILDEKENYIEVLQSSGFNLEHIGGHNSEVVPYEMRFSLESTPHVEYEYLESSYNYIAISNPNEEEKYDTVALNDANYPLTQNGRVLKEPLRLSGSEIIHVFRSYKAKYVTVDSSIVSDLYYAANYTIDVEIVLNRKPALYDFNVVPTTRDVVKFAKKDGKEQINIPFFLPGQGFFIQITKKI